MAKIEDYIHEEAPALNVVLTEEQLNQLADKIAKKLNQ